MPDLATALKEAINRATNTTTKENQMLHTNTTANQELVKLANDWAKDDPTEAKQQDTQSHGFTITNNVTRATFACIRDNPGKTAAEVWHLMQEQGYKRDSVATLISQMTKVGMVEKDEDGRLRTLVPEYTKISSKELQAIREKEKKAKRALVRAQTKELRAAIAKLPHVLPKDTVKIKVKPSNGIAALAKNEPVVETKTIATPMPVALNTFDVDKLLDTLTFAQTMALYKKLKTMFGEL